MRAFSIGACLASALALAAGCSGPSEDDPIAAALDDAASTAAPGEPATIDLGELTEIEWERVHFLGPYVGRDEAEERLGFSWPEGDDLDSMSERDQFILFVRGREVVGVVRYPFERHRTSLACVETAHDGFVRLDASFDVVRVIEPDSGRPAHSTLVPTGLDGREREDFLWECGPWIEAGSG
jgi:hypothetical protein